MSQQAWADILTFILITLIYTVIFHFPEQCQTFIILIIILHAPKLAMKAKIKTKLDKTKMLELYNNLLIYVR